VTINPAMRLNKPNIRQMLDILSSKGLRMSDMNQEHVLVRPVGWTISAAAALSILAGASVIPREAAAEDANAAFGGTSQHPSVAQISKNVSLSPIAASASFTVPSMARAAWRYATAAAVASR